MWERLRPFAPVWRVLEGFDTVRGYWGLVPAPIRWILGLTVVKLVPSLFLGFLAWLADPSNILAVGLVFAVALIVTWWVASKTSIPYPLAKRDTQSTATKHDVR